MSKIFAIMTWLQRARTWCQDLDQTWNRETPFVEVAREHFSKINWSQDFDLTTMIQEFMTTKAGEQQYPNSNFGNPPFTIYSAPDKKFALNIYIWQEAHTSIHEHSFEGCFAVLKGSSLESTYHFSSQKSLGDESHIGKLSSTSVRYLLPGDLSVIQPGNKLIHRVIHLENPTVSLVLRTLTNDQTQMAFYFDSLSSPSHLPGEATAKLRVLEWMIRSGLSVTKPIVEDILPYYQCWQILLSNAATFNLGKKLSLEYSNLDFLLGHQKWQGFNKALMILPEANQKLALCLMEQFGADWRTEYTRLKHEGATQVEADIKENLIKNLDSFAQSNYFLKNILEGKL